MGVKLTARYSFGWAIINDRWVQQLIPTEQQRFGEHWCALYEAERFRAICATLGLPR